MHAFVLVRLAYANIKFIPVTASVLCVVSKELLSSPTAMSGCLAAWFALLFVHQGTNHLSYSTGIFASCKWFISIFSHGSSARHASCNRFQAHSLSFSSWKQRLVKCACAEYSIWYLDLILTRDDHLGFNVVRV